MAEFATITCRTCGGVAHPSSGCVYSPTFIVCGPCVRSFWAWLRQHMNGKGRRKGPRFYDHAAPTAPPTTASNPPS